MAVMLNNGNTADNSVGPDMLREWVNTNQNTRNFGQGQLMGAIGGGFA